MLYFSNDSSKQATTYTICGKQQFRSCGVSHLNESGGLNESIPWFSGRYLLYSRMNLPFWMNQLNECLYDSLIKICHHLLAVRSVTPNFGMGFTVNWHTLAREGQLHRVQVQRIRSGWANKGKPPWSCTMTVREGSLQEMHTCVGPAARASVSSVELRKL